VLAVYIGCSGGKKVNVKVTLKQAIMAQRSSRGMYSFTLSLTLAPHVGGWSTPRPWHFTARKYTRYPLHRRLSGPQAWSARIQKILAPPGLDPRTVQPVEGRETDYDIPAHGSLVLGDGRSVDVLASNPFVGSLPDLTYVHGCSFVPPFWSPSDDRMGLSVVVFIIYSETCIKWTLNVTKACP
jgi:hypothetical protein